MSVNYIPRVTQLDAVQLDDEVLELLKQQLVESTRYFSPGLLTYLTPELELLLRSLIFKYSVYEKRLTFGQQMLSIKYNSKDFSRSKLYWYYTFTALLKYAKDRTSYSFTRNVRLQDTLEAMGRFQAIADMLNALRFLSTGRSPRLVDFLLNLEVTADKVSRPNFNDFSWTRELLWNNFIELFGTLLSLTNMFSWKAKVKSILRKLKSRTATQQEPLENVQIDLSSRCAECNRRPILPHHMGCKHVFCYYCLQGNKQRDPTYCCPNCNYCGVKVIRVTVT